MLGKIVGVLLLGFLAGVCFWIAGISRHAQDSQGFWMFAAFGLLFFVPLCFLIADLIPSRSRNAKKSAAAPQSRRFVPHWFMMGAIIVLGLCVVSWIWSVVTAVIKMIFE